MPLPVHHRANFSTLLRAARAGDLCVMECLRLSDSAPVALLCAAATDPADGSVTFTPFAEMINGNPFDLYAPPGPSNPAGFLTPTAP